MRKLARTRDPHIFQCMLRGEPPDVYGITARGFRDMGQVEAARAMVRGGATMVQYREKEADDRTKLAEIKAIKEICDEHATERHRPLLIVNDRLDLAILGGADGVHLGQKDIDISNVFSMGHWSEKRMIGITVSNVREAAAAELHGADYIAVAPVFESKAKPRSRTVRIEGLAAIRSEVSLPIFAAGGVGPEHFRALREAGAEGVALMSAILQSPDPKAQMSKLIADWKVCDAQ